MAAHAPGRRAGRAMSSSSVLEKPQIIAHTQQGLSHTVFECKWVPCSARFVCLGSFPRGTGVIQLYELQSGRLSLLRQVSGRRLRPGRSKAPSAPFPPLGLAPRCLLFIFSVVNSIFMPP